MNEETRNVLKTTIEYLKNTIQGKARGNLKQVNSFTDLSYTRECHLLIQFKKF